MKLSDGAGARVDASARRTQSSVGVTDCEPFTRVPESNVLDETNNCRKHTVQTKGSVLISVLC